METKIELSDLLINNFNIYANHIVYERAIPLLNDGLKPVQRRVLLSLKNLSLWHNKPYKKCAKVIGDTVGQYHPHSMDGPYSALVNMTADFTARYPLCDGVGNYGSLENDPPAAYRYTETRLHRNGELLLDNTNMITVPWVSTYDNEGEEPIYLGGFFPNILCNNTGGIAAGVSSMIPSHNATEVITALIKVIDRLNKDKKWDLNYILKYIKGPDFPTGGIITNASDIKSIYTNGRGKFIIRGEYVEKKREIVFHSIPYTTNIGAIMSGLKKLRENKLCGEFKNFSANGNVAISIKPAKGQSIKDLVDIIFKKTKLEDNFNSIFTVIWNNKVIEHISLVDIISYLLSHYRKILSLKLKKEYNNNNSLLAKYRTIILAIKNSKTILDTIKKSSSPLNDIKLKLNIEDEAANYILSMRVSDFSKLSADDYSNKIKILDKRNTEIEKILSQDKNILEEVKKELKFVLKEYFSKDKRLTTIC